MGKRIPVYWLGKVPEECQLCGKPIGSHFVDGKVRGTTQWAYMDPDCYALEGAGFFGAGLGQQYERQEDGQYLKVKG